LGSQGSTRSPVINQNVGHLYRNKNPFSIEPYCNKKEEEEGKMYIKKRTRTRGKITEMQFDGGLNA